MTYEQQNNELLTNIINPFFNYWSKTYTEQDIIKNDLKVNDYFMSLELYITPECNQACKYCYLIKHKNEIYPKELQDHEQILKNIDDLLNYLTLTDKSLPRIELFSGEIWGYPFGNKIFDIILKYLNQGLKIKSIIIPTNGSFCQNEKIVAIINNYIFEFMKLKCRLIFSLSYDGIILDNLNRPSINSQVFDKNNNKYINNLFLFAKRNEYGFHPMISFSQIEKQIENYQSWINLLKKYYPENEKQFKKTYGMIMQLEIREHGWTDDKIISYLKWLKFLIDTDIKEYFDNDVKKFLYHGILGFETDEYKFNNTYFPYRPGESGNFLGCALGRALIIRAGDLSIVSCHRTSYEQFILGQLKINKDKIEIIAKNVALASAVYMTNFKTKPFCSDCVLKGNCIRYCLGANYEANQELFYPEEDNCNLQKAKNIFLILYYSKLEILNEIPILQIIKNNFINEEPEVYNKWKIIIQEII